MTAKINPWMETAKKQVELFQNDNVAWMNVFITSEAIKTIMETAYRVLTREKKVVEIENMAQSDKKTLWETANDFAKGKLAKDELIRVCKGLVALEYLLQ